jgi:hypothetical protein
MKPKTGRKRPSRGNRYYRCAKFGGVYYEFIGVTGGCPNKHCLRDNCPNYIKPRPKPGRPPTEAKRTPEEDIRHHRERMREFRAATAALSRREMLKLAEADVEMMKRLVGEQRREVGPLPVDHWDLRRHLQCRRYLEGNLICKLPRRSCKFCPHQVDRRLHRGRVRGSGMYNWGSQQDRREYYRGYRRKQRQKDKKQDKQS